MMARRFLILGCMLGGLAVAAGAFGAHSLRDLVTPERLDVFETAVRYQMYHALALLGVAWLTERVDGRTASTAGYLFVVGTLIFSGSLYLLVLTGMTWLGAITPLGGVAFIAGWIALAVAAAQLPRDTSG